RPALAAAAEADAIMLDLEDSLPTEKKSAGRAFLEEAIEVFGALNPKIWVRVNNDEANLGSDLAMVTRLPVMGIETPKVEDVSIIRRIESVMRNDQWIIPVLETPRGVLSASEILLSSKKIGGAVFGSE